ncbi:MAG: ceramidase domain-containing protein [Gammaproteobacteria bacterium]
MIDLYCERLGPGLLAEPLNAATNAFFLVAGALCLRRARNADAVVLAGLIVAIGIGSALFHTFATAWAQWLDVAPILAFQVGFLGCYLRRLLGWSGAAVAAALAAFVLVVGFAGVAGDVLNGSLAYLPAALALGLIGAERWQRTQRVDLVLAAGLFVLSLVARTADQALCALWPPGTHFVWHTLNALVLYLALGAIIERRPPTAAA